MQVLGIGNVTECNRSYIFTNDGGKQGRIRSTPELLRSIKETASLEVEVYRRMGEELSEAYEKRIEDAKKRYHFITDDMVKEAFRSGDHKQGTSLSFVKDSNNEECIRQYAKVSGWFEAVEFARGKYWEVQRLLVQAKNGLELR